MKYVKMFALVAIATGALVAFIGAGSASATVLCSTTADPCPAGQDWPVGTVLDWSIPPGQSFLQTNTAGETLQTCTGSTMKGKITKTGGATETVTAQTEENNLDQLFFYDKNAEKCGL